MSEKIEIQRWLSINTSPRRHVDLRFLPSIVPEAFRNETAQIVEPELASRIAKLRSLIDAGVIESESVLGSCIFLIPRTACISVFRRGSKDLMPVFSSRRSGSCERSRKPFAGAGRRNSATCGNLDRQAPFNVHQWHVNEQRMWDIVRVP